MQHGKNYTLPRQTSDYFKFYIVHFSFTAFSTVTNNKLAALLHYVAVNNICARAHWHAQINQIMHKIDGHRQCCGVTAVTSMSILVPIASP